MNNDYLKLRSKLNPNAKKQNKQKKPKNKKNLVENVGEKVLPRKFFFNI